MRRTWRLSFIASALVVVTAVLAGESEPAKKDADKEAVQKEVDSYLKSRGVGEAKDVVTVGAGKLKLSGLLQVWFNYIEDDNRDIRGNANEGNDNDTFRIRRAEIKLSGEITPEVKWTVMIDPARADVAGEYTNGVLQDAYIELGLIKWHTIWIGQGKRPIGRESNWSSAKLPLPERAMLSRDVLNGDARDLGIKIVGEYKDTPLDWFTWQLGLFNGFGSRGVGHQNRLDDNDDKDIVSRINIRLLGKKGALLRDSQGGDLEIGFSRMDGKQGERRRGVTATATALSIYEDTWHYAMGFDMEYHYRFKEMGEIWLAAEYLEGSGRPTFNTAGVTPTPTIEQPDQVVNQNGWYAMIGYRFGGTGVRFVDGLETVFRYEQWENIIRPGLVTKGRFDVFRTEIATFGINYYIKGHNAKIQFAYDIVNDPNKGTYPDRHGFREVSNDQVRLAVQISF